MYPVKTPFFIQKLFPSLIWCCSKNEKKIYLTFDDGPIPEVTPWVLKELKKYNIPATFFCVGENIIKYPEIYKELIKENQHSIGNHTFHHLSGWKTKVRSYKEDINKCQKLLTEKRLFRPPYGEITPKQIEELKPEFKIVMWDVLSGDFDKNISPEKCLNNVTNNVQNGSIIVFHDSLKAEKNMKFTLPRFIEWGLSEGFQFGCI